MSSNLRRPADQQLGGGPPLSLDILRRRESTRIPFKKGLKEFYDDLLRAELPYSLHDDLVKKTNELEPNLEGTGFNTLLKMPDFRALYKGQTWGRIAHASKIGEAALKCASLSCGEDRAQGFPLLRCAGCAQVQYCGKGCQKKDWNSHKQFCKKPVENSANVQQDTSVQLFNLLSKDPVMGLFLGWYMRRVLGYKTNDKRSFQRHFLNFAFDISFVPDCHSKLYEYPQIIDVRLEGRPLVGDSQLDIQSMLADNWSDDDVERAMQDRLGSPRMYWTMQAHDDGSQNAVAFSADLNSETMQSWDGPLWGGTAIMDQMFKRVSKYGCGELM